MISEFCSQDFSVNKTLVTHVSMVGIMCFVEFSSSLGMRIMFVFA